MTLSGPLGELAMEVEVIDVSSALPYADPDWRFTDAAGHEHYRAEGGYPTLRHHLDSVERWWCEDCGEEHVEERGHYECPLCGETVQPGSKVDTHRRFQPGLRSYTLDGQPISQERYEEILAQYRAGA